ncbi:MAG: glycosyltransferase family 39 protein [Chloroflexi bacterium]|nr:glycosyltransferase family 39 protein [Chloroflexota bacterium]
MACALWQLDSVPPGWRDDELINSLVISQHVLDGEWAVYYPDASGHEALYHALNAIFLALFGATVWGIRYLSVLLGTLTVALTYRFGKKLFGVRWGWQQQPASPPVLGADVCSHRPAPCSHAAADFGRLLLFLAGICSEYSKSRD